ncbi:HSP20-like chaperone [Dactylonectria macrodidyma]|uniref:HSP20-like chaperone n=1 Tax=Dactylonectria macrodidyma TaxID=307937 RepID=A0A9P9EHE4_9HYPO|nr:HSP20-like chaperone [Dactylonectria macrodidyma]
MALFPRHFYNSDSSFTPLFRLLDDYDSYTRQGQSGRDTSLLRWRPKFDVCETRQAYELHGELPGIDKKAVHIEFTEPQTMVIRGKLERTYTSGHPPAGFIEGATMRGAIVGDDEEPDTSQPAQRTEESDKKGDDKTKYWLAERSVGEFSRTFSFPSQVDQDSVSAKFQDGILSVVIPKVKKHESRRIHVS